MDNPREGKFGGDGTERNGIHPRGASALSSAAAVSTSHGLGLDPKSPSPSPP
jgi:hypothetical protein